MPLAATQHFFPLVDRKVFAGTNVKFVLGGKLPLGACYHQKAIIIDDALAFVGGGTSVLTDGIRLRTWMTTRGAKKREKTIGASTVAMRP